MFMPDKRYIRIPIISGYNSSYVFMSIDSISCCYMASVRRPAVKYISLYVYDHIKGNLP
ncbi:hypothetical protein RO3G_15630 [Rhizopus delemar RA 99-880]|uniref:Uncharacterized protein n=1 Tax=Rhizopus delemar (strain RA 99-880 / ATCC MYA-4621 / FGSC 9543 / NRRL 43880) TaxID=246409 RepID=I1CR39_RHIO9|nr:hypothetical protein RO3G_15630 [Rhizopus delemar RA 99-880]|eukprot:EIE90919.1 hypothetical protein RO3G_15630 [Rhizopus delemar RA 99-880]